MDPSFRPCGSGGSGGSGGSSGSRGSSQQAAQAAAAATRTDLTKAKCDKLLGFSSASAAQSWFDIHITFYYTSLGDLQVKNGAPAIGTPPPASTSTFGQVNINLDYSWSNFSAVPTSAGGTFNYLGYLNNVYGISMSSSQLGTLIIIHELEHNLPQGAQETAQGGQNIYYDCIK
jgi:hypothetical protein